MNSRCLSSPGDSEPREARPHRRDIMRAGVKLAFVPPIVSTFHASQAYAANYSCYGLGHSCDTSEDPERCCPGLDCTGPQPKTCK